MKMKTSMFIERFREDPDGIGGFVQIWNPYDEVMGVFCQDAGYYKFIYKCCNDVSTRDRFRLGNRHFEIKEIVVTMKDRWKIARLKEIHHGA
jgi:hypothetical protein